MPAAIRQDDLRRRNRALVIAAVRKAGAPSRTDIAGTTRLSHSTISTICTDLIAEGVLIETKGAEGGAARRGRPQVALALNPQACAIVTVVILLNYLQVSVVDYAGTPVAGEERRLPTRDMDAAAFLAQCGSMIERLVSRPEIAAIRLVRMVVAVQGTTDVEGRTLLWSPITKGAGIAFAAEFERGFGIPVTVENDCNMIAVALRWRNPERYRNDFIAILLSHGIGMGMVLKGELFTGTHSSGGEFGHMVHQPGGALCRCGRRGCIEAYAGDYGIWRRAHGLEDDTPPVADIREADMRALAASARAANGPERNAYRCAGEAIGFGLGSLFALIDPAPVAVVGSGVEAFDIIEPHLRSALARTAGGQHAQAISFATESDELPLIRLGCAMRALTAVDKAIFANAGQDRPLPATAGRSLGVAGVDA